MKRLTLLKNWNNEAFNASSLHLFIASSLHRGQHYINSCRNFHKTEQNTNVKAKAMMFFGFATEITIFFWKLPMEFIASSLLCVNIFFFKALRQWGQNKEAMKQWNINYGKKLKQWSDESVWRWQRNWSDEALNASSHRFIASALLLPSFVCVALLGLHMLAHFSRVLGHCITFLKLHVQAHID